jgi:hypothetical protein
MLVLAVETFDMAKLSLFCETKPMKPSVSNQYGGKYIS